MEQISVFGDIDFPENEQICSFIDFQHSRPYRIQWEKL